MLIGDSLEVRWSFAAVFLEIRCTLGGGASLLVGCVQFEDLGCLAPSTIWLHVIDEQGKYWRTAHAPGARSSNWTIQHPGGWQLLPVRLLERARLILA